MHALSKPTFALLSLIGLLWLSACSTEDPAMRTSETLAQEASTTTATNERPRPDAATLQIADVEAKHKLSSSPERLPASMPIMAKQAGVRQLQESVYPVEPTNTEQYATFDDNPVRRVVEHPVSTFSIDVDTGAYANVRRLLKQGRLPVKDAVRVEEMINYFGYDYPQPKDTAVPFSVNTELAPAPWNPHAVLLRVGLKAYDINAKSLPPANLVFLVDVSGSMQAPDKLPLLQSGLGLLVQQLRAQDKLSLVVYAGHTAVVLPPTPGDQKASIRAALNALTAGGSTNGGAGIDLAYAMAQQAYIKGGINRVILATDGDFNVGTVSFEALKNRVQEKRKSGISLTTLGFGGGNYNDHLMEQLADSGNGNYAYIDTLSEANKVLVSEMSSTLQTVAKDVKIQIEFNPATVAEYRLIGYENRVLRREDFNNDKVDAGEIGAAHTVTALYELTLVGAQAGRIDALRYQREIPDTQVNKDEIGLLRLRYKLAQGDTSTLIEHAMRSVQIKDSHQASADFRFAAAVAGFGQLLRGGKYTEKFDYDQVLELARAARGEDRFGYRGEFISLVNLAKSLDGVNRAAQRE